MNERCYLVEIYSNDKIHFSAIGWTRSVVVSNLYYRQCVNEYGIDENDICLVELQSKEELTHLVEAMITTGMLPNLKEEVGQATIETVLEWVELQVHQPKSIGGECRMVIATPQSLEGFANDGCFEGMDYDMCKFIHDVHVMERILCFLRPEQSITKTLKNSIALLAKYAELIAVRRTFDCENSEHNKDLQSEEFQLLRNSLALSSIEVLYDDECGYGMSVFDDLTWLIESRFSGIGWVL